MTPTDVSIKCLGPGRGSGICRGEVGIAIGEDFHPKGFLTMNKADMPVAVKLSQMISTVGDPVWFPCANRWHHTISDRAIALAVIEARANRQGEKGVQPDPAAEPLLVREDGTLRPHIWWEDEDPEGEEP